MRRLINMMAFAALTAVSSAQVMKIGTYTQDAFIYGINGSSNSGYINVQWSGYETPNYGHAGWRVVVWDTTMPQAPIASETYHAGFYDSNYSRTFAVAPYHSIRVELYAVGDQYANSASLSSTVTTSMWVTPVEMPGSNTSWNYPPVKSLYTPAPRVYSGNVVILP